MGHHVHNKEFHRQCSGLWQWLWVSLNLYTFYSQRERNFRGCSLQQRSFRFCKMIGGYRAELVPCRFIERMVPMSFSRRDRWLAQQLIWFTAEERLLRGWYLQHTFLLLEGDGGWTEQIWRRFVLQLDTFDLRCKRDSWGRFSSCEPQNGLVCHLFILYVD